MDVLCIIADVESDLSDTDFEIDDVTTVNRLITPTYNYRVKHSLIVS